MGSSRDLMEIYGLLEQLHRRDAALIRVGQMFAQAAVLLRKIWDHQGFARGNRWEIHGKSMGNPWEIDGKSMGNPGFCR